LSKNRVVEEPLKLQAKGIYILSWGTKKRVAFKTKSLLGNESSKTTVTTKGFDQTKSLLYPLDL
jgi:hypothetical protein